MVDPNSPVFNCSEKVGLFIGKGIRCIILSGIVLFIGVKLSGSRPSQPVTNPPSAAPPSF